MLNPVPRADGLGALRNRGSAYDGCGFLMPVQRIIGGIEIKDEDYGGRGFSCYDLEGHLWNFGTYDPW